MSPRKTVRIPRFATSGSASDRTSHASVSLPAAPWDAQAQTATKPEPTQKEPHDGHSIGTE